MWRLKNNLKIMKKVLAYTLNGRIISDMEITNLYRLGGFLEPDTGEHHEFSRNPNQQHQISSSRKRPFSAQLPNKPRAFRLHDNIRPTQRF
jgi:hypothetical protein